MAVAAMAADGCVRQVLSRPTHGVGERGLYPDGKWNERDKKFPKKNVKSKLGTKRGQGLGGVQRRRKLHRAVLRAPNDVDACEEGAGGAVRVCGIPATTAATKEDCPIFDALLCG